MNDTNIVQPSDQANANTLVNSYTAANYSTGQSSATNCHRTATPQTMQTHQQQQTVIGVFESRSSAEKAVNILRRQGFTNEEINIISKKGQEEEKTVTDDDSIIDGTLTGGTIGGIGGLILGAAGALTIPGIGPIIAGGSIATALTGAIAGGIAGGLIDWGIPAEESRHYEQEVAHGSILAMIRTDAAKASAVAQMLQQNGAKEVKSHNKY